MYRKRVGHCSIEFFFTDIDVLEANRNNSLQKKKELPLPPSMKNCKNDEMLTTWNYWFDLATIIRKRIRGKIKKNLPNGGKAIMTFGHKDGTITFTIQPWAAKLFDLSEISVFPSPPYDPLMAYTEIIIKTNKL